jgi:hypothetical protein
MPLTLIKRAGPSKSSETKVKGRLRVKAQAPVAKDIKGRLGLDQADSAKAGQRQIRGQEFFVTVAREALIGEAVTAPSNSKHLIFSLN